MRRYGKYPRRRRRLIVAAVLVVLGLSAAVRLWGLGEPREYMFDETYYAQDAAAIVEGRVGPADADLPWEPGDEVSWPHPEIGKLSIALGILAFGDGPWGWRLPSVVAGLALLACVYPLARRLGLGTPWALAALLLAACDLLGIAQSRIATLDVFVAVWTALCVLLALRYVQSGRSRLDLALCGLSGGLALATKWSGALALIAAALVIAIETWLPRTRERAPGVVRSRAREGALLGLSLVVLPALVYVASYAQYFLSGHSLADWRELHAQMWHFNWTLSAPHSYASAAPTWIFDYRPVWYSFERAGGDFVGMVAMGNPFLWWLSVIAVVVALALALRRLDGVPLLALAVVAALYLPWFAASRTSFLFYMAPVAPFLAILVAGTLEALERTCRRPGAEAASPRRALIAFAAGFVGAALGWALVAGAAVLLFWELPARVSRSAAVVTTAVAIVAVVVVVVVVFTDSRLLRLRGVLVWLLPGVVCGIAVPFLPIVLNVPISPDDFYRLMWLRSWI